ncbi:YdcH family protein [Paracoccus beibuensis]|uniref:YdcH family protein n=1 Tax=Paracoccus beibuensis TaxID=547602 RepID=UPI002240274D|nr:YdcH family protein [Paracoccus beibuensis]
MTYDDISRTRLDALRVEHRQLDEAIAALQGDQLTSSLALQRLKRQKLVLKDRIARLEDELTPDIIA